MIEECLGRIDVVIELVDARIPLSSKNPDIMRLCKDKPRMIVLNKSDLSDSIQNKKWLQYYREQGYHAILFDSKNKKKNSSNLLLDQIHNFCSEKTRKW